MRLYSILLDSTNSTSFGFIRLDHHSSILFNRIRLYLTLFDSTTRSRFYSTSFDFIRPCSTRPPEFDFIRPHSPLEVLQKSKFRSPRSAGIKNNLLPAKRGARNFNFCDTSNGFQVVFAVPSLVALSLKTIGGAAKINFSIPTLGRDQKNLIPAERGAQNSNFCDTSNGFPLVFAVPSLVALAVALAFSWRSPWLGFALPWLRCWTELMSMSRFAILDIKKTCLPRVSCVLPDAQLSPQLLQFLESPLSSLLLSTPAFTFSLGHAFMGSARSNQLLLPSAGHRFRHYSGGVDWVHPAASPGECRIPHRGPTQKSLSFASIMRLHLFYSAPPTDISPRLPLPHTLQSGGNTSQWIFFNSVFPRFP